MADIELLPHNVPSQGELPELVEELTTLNLGPTHPATHGIFQNILKMDGEKIVSGEQTIGYIHRAFEKIAERRPFYQITTLTDRMNYCSSPINNLGWHMTVEKLLGVEVPKRAQYIRVLMMELARITDHIICNSILGVDTGAFTGFLYVMQKREEVYEIYEEVCGARLTTNMGRLGGMERDLSSTAIRKIKEFIKSFPPVLRELEKLLNRNRIFMDRTINVGSISAERALSYGFTGPNLRAAGVDYDVRVMNPYSSYQDFEFDVPIGQNGDTYDRYMVRNEEMWQSLRIVEQAINNLPEGPYYADAPEYYLPPKNEVYRNMEALIYHFKIVMGEIDAPAGEVYHAVEGGNGELGFYLISDGGRAPYRLHFRRPSFIYYQAYPEMCKGSSLSDAILTMSSLNVIAGELDA
ncbi:NADH-quinone oxidoreductase subunit D [Dyadobacter sp. BE34]|uniref:NADH-quinone oxidoreductase subunit D n=1 Tax=Dyadobacter fermentans TaxID=94254 RepID=A0ABU1QPD5_9BACT|nr:MULTISPECIES: NADH dehydrogenase (quinone) subunit D [Dyadobacter]MBZ1358369.1 NADH-quinone oxidoreductase subunit D [Dyadobacter fermentans]MDR6803013.1 NADH-quinone oxidoreductase subunit D [Dyadobacter fermentans]MDR7040755.1 NADH-quinone oxidoreductase subunit D [Dyadobacter sp. BE242]MDR7195157.1 NADH-quinone oxidoreductase subunit D [Dyadobacter sp. BE34]MDR7214298.1 NADH-quinone oxidoreductase subunit D [Dyadobacter sp. BE31]